MTREEAIAVLEQEAHYIYGDDKPYDRQAFDMAIKALEQEPCEDAISRQEVLDAMYELCDTGETFNENLWRDNPHIDAIADAINNLPSVTPQPKTGHWIYSKAVNTGEIIFSECSVCGNGESRCAKRMNYCPNCGAKMESEDKEGE